MRKSSLYVCLFAAAWLLIALGTAGAQTNVGSVNIGSSGTSTVTLTVATAGTVSRIAVVTQGATGLEFANAGGGTCATGTTYAATATCTVAVKFKSRYAGPSYGAAILYDEFENALATDFLQGTGTGAQVAFGPAEPTAINPLVNGLRLYHPSSCTVDAVGNLFIADSGNNRVVKVAAGNDVASAIAPIVNGEGLNAPTQVAVDGAGNLYISDSGNDRVVEILAGGGNPIVIDPTADPGHFGDGLHRPIGVAADGAGNLFIADGISPYRVVKLTPAGVATKLSLNADGRSIGSVGTIAVDGAGDLFVPDPHYTRVIEFPPDITFGGVDIGPLFNGGTFFLNQPLGVTVDAAGVAFIADEMSYELEGNTAVVEVQPDGTAFNLVPKVKGIPLSGPVGVTLDGAGDLFIADSGNSRILELKRSQPPALTFANTLVDTTSSDSPQAVQVQNVGNAALTVTGISYPTDFPVEAGGETTPCTSSISLTLGEICDLNIDFNPMSGGLLAENVTLTDNALNVSGTVQSIPVGGAGSTTVSLSATMLSFGVEKMGATSSSQTVMLTNTGGIAFSITSISVTGAGSSSFIFANNCGASLAAGASCTIHGHFTPTASGALSAVLKIIGNAINSPLSIALSGTGYNSSTTVSLSATSIDFGIHTVGTTGPTHEVILTNTGMATLYIASISVMGANDSSFVFAGTGFVWSDGCAASLAAGASCTIHGHFTPTATGALSASVQIVDNAPGSPNSFSLSGTGN
jgi:hypothetical protein